MKTAKSPYPEWIDQYRKPGTEIRKIGNNFYVYAISSYYDPVRKKGRKKTGPYLGRITESEGFIEAASKKVPRTYVPVNSQSLSSKDYGLWSFISDGCTDIMDGIKEHFPNQWEWIAVALYCRLVHTSPLKNMSYYFKRSFLSELFDITVNSKTVSTMIRDIGLNREPIIQYMRQLSRDKSLVLMDATSIVSYSNNLTRVEEGYTKYKSFEPLFNLLYFYCPRDYIPAYYRLFNGNIKDVKMISMTLEESGYKNAMIIADKGFYSQENLKILEMEGLKYIIPLKRDSTLIKKNRYKKMMTTTQNFLFADRVVYYDSYSVGKGRYVHLYIDEPMMVNEKRDYIHRMKKHPHNYSEEDFAARLPFFGSFAVITNQKDESESVFVNYKSRVGVEILFDGVKNILGNDYTYMQNDEALEGWMFINHLALQVHHKIYALLKEKNLLGKYSIRDFIQFLSDIRKVRVNDKWILEPMIDKQKKLVQELGITIP